MRLPLLAALTLAAATIAPPRGAGAQESAYRFEITAVGDSTFTFPLGRNRWLHPGLQGIAVDPMRRDALVARFRVLRVTPSDATALITGQTTRLTTEHVALIERPRRPWYRSAAFWVGTLLGGAVGFAIGR